METTTLNGMSAVQLMGRLAEALKTFRLNQNYTQIDIAKKSNCSLLTVQKIEKGENVGIKYIMRFIIAVGAYEILLGMNEVKQFPTIENYKVVYKKRVRNS